MITAERPAALPAAHSHDTLRISAAGSAALLLDAAQDAFDPVTQERIWALAARLHAAGASDGILEAVPGVNNLLVVFDPARLPQPVARERLAALWEGQELSARPGRDIEIPVVYGGAPGEDLPALATAAGVSIEALVTEHSSATYSVACIGAYPGFAFMTGLPARLCTPRRKVPRMAVPKGSVIIGGSQAGVMPCSAPSGWHLIGRTDVNLFDTSRHAPCLLSPGDRVRFRIKGIES